ncbi:MAG: hypothetical protein GY838_05965 [bacterium]|nr:hypothetical protein [bacterium]
MKTLTHVILIAALALAVGCGGDSGGGPTTPPVTDAAILSLGWTAYGNDDPIEAEEQFRKLLDRGKLLAEAHDGLGWMFSSENEPDSAAVHFAAAVAEGADALPIGDQTRAGQAFAASAQGQHQASLDAAAEVAAGWVFTHDTTIDYDDVIVVRAVSHYALAGFEAALAAVQELEPGFTADVGTVDGRGLLAAKIEELIAG